MDNRFTPEELAFQAEVRQFFAENWNADMEARFARPDNFREAMIAWQRALHKQGWMAPAWPAEYGGPGWTPAQIYIFDTERAMSGAPDVLPFGPRMVGPVIYTFGNDEQKKKYLPRILASEDWWCQGYSEPGAGSDLAALKTRAERRGDEYIVNGAKIWTSYAHLADWIFCLVRTMDTGTRQEGITFLLIDMRSAGIQVSPIITMDGHHSLNEVSFEDVRVPAENRIGEEHKGWTYAKALLAHERTGIAGVADSKSSLVKLKALAAKEPRGGGGAMLDDPAFQRRIADIEIELMALEYTELRVLAQMQTGGTPGPESSLLKIKGTQVQLALHELRLQLCGNYMGMQAPEGEPDPSGHEFADTARRQYMYGRAAPIFGGTNEIQKNIIAKFVLGI